MDNEQIRRNIRSILDKELSVGWYDTINSHEGPYWPDYVVDGKDRATERIYEEIIFKLKYE